MAKIDNIDDFKSVTSSITSFSHAYLFNVNSLTAALPFIKEFAKLILFGQDYNNEIYSDMCYQIDDNTFDDLYIVNPNTIGINTEEINKLLSYMETKSVREDGKRVYIIYGFERLTLDVSNKILKFLEEPEDNIYALLMTENFEKILPTIVSRCQVLSYYFPIDDSNFEQNDLIKKFISDLVIKKKQMIAYEYEYLADILKDRVLLYNAFENIERIISECINLKSGFKYDDIYICNKLLDYSINNLINILNITNNLKCLIKNNINLNLMIDRYIIEVAEELE